MPCSNHIRSYTLVMLVHCSDVASTCRGNFEPTPSLCRHIQSIDNAQSNALDHESLVICVVYLVTCLDRLHAGLDFLAAGAPRLQQTANRAGE